jgi:uncharacterized membrane protein
MAASMAAINRGACCVAIAVAASFGGVAPPAHGDPGITAYPGMEIRQGATVCTLGMVETTLRIAVATGQCDGGSIATDSHGNVLGSVMSARHDTASPAVDGSVPDVQYEVIRLDDGVMASDVLPTGRQLQSAPGVLAQAGASVCHFGISTGQSCGRVTSVNNNRFTLVGVAADPRDIGGPVYTVNDNRAVIVGVFEGVTDSVPTAESWQAVMQQLFLDGRSPGQGPQQPTVRIAGWQANTT